MISGPLAESVSQHPLDAIEGCNCTIEIDENVLLRYL